MPILLPVTDNLLFLNQCKRDQIFSKWNNLTDARVNLLVYCLRTGNATNRTTAHRHVRQKLKLYKFVSPYPTDPKKMPWPKIIYLNSIHDFFFSFHFCRELIVQCIGRFQSIKNGVLLIFSFITSDKTEFLSPMIFSKEYITGIWLSEFYRIDFLLLSIKFNTNV